MTRERIQTGARGEDQAALFLQRRGYRILDRNYRCPLGELDIIAEESGMIAFVEVRTRRQGSMVRPEETVNWAKASRVARLADYYLAAKGLEDRPWRIDVVAVHADPVDAAGSIQLYQDAMADVERRR